MDVVSDRRGLGYNGLDWRWHEDLLKMLAGDAAEGGLFCRKNSGLTAQATNPGPMTRDLTG